MRQLGLLLWLKWKLMIRGYLRDTTALVAVLLSVLVFLPMSLGIALGAAFGFIALDPPYDEHLLRLGTLLIYAFWLLTPLAGYSLNESYDITRLFAFPMSMRSIFTGAVIGSLIDFPMLFLLPLLAAIVVGFTTAPLASCSLSWRFASS